MIHFHPLLPSLLVIAVVGALCVAVVWLGKRLSLPAKRTRWITRLCLAALIIGGIMILNLGLTFRTRGGRGAKLAILLDCSASMQIQDMPDGKSRHDAAVKAARKLHSQTAKGWGKHIYRFNALATATQLDDLNQMQPAGSTELSRALSTVQSELGNGTTVVVISDGISPGTVTPTSGMELYSVAIGTDCAAFPDLGLGEIRAPEMMRAGDGCDFAVPVEMRGYALEREIALTVVIDGRNAGELKHVVQPGKPTIFSCRTDFQDAGIHTIEFTLPQLPDELTYLNNQRKLSVEVRDDRRCTLLCYPLLNTGFRPLQRMLGGNDTIALYKLNNNDVWQTVTAEGQGGYFKNGFPATPDELKEIDLLILGSTRANDFTPQERAVLEKYAEDGGTIITMAGNEGAFESDGDAAWEALMPARQADCHLREGNFKVIPPADQTSPLAELARQTDDIAIVNATEQLKDGTTCLLELRGERNYPMLLSMPYGKGRVFALMVNPIRSWGGSAERSATFRRFWAQLLAEADDGRNEHLKVELTDNVIHDAQRIGVTVTPPDERYAVRASFQPDGKANAMPLTLQRGGNGIHSGKFSPMQHSSGTLLVVANAEGRRQYRRFLRLENPSELQEHTEIRMRPEAFLKFTPPGHLHTIESIPAMADELDRLLRDDSTEKTFQPVFETPYFLAALLALLLAQWFIRRKAGMF